MAKIPLMFVVHVGTNIYIPEILYCYAKRAEHNKGCPIYLTSLILENVLKNTHVISKIWETQQYNMLLK